MSDSIELCQAPFNGGRCHGVLYRPQPDLILCPRCGGHARGVTYVLRDRLVATVVLYLIETARHQPQWREAYEHAAVVLEAMLTRDSE